MDSNYQLFNAIPLPSLKPSARILIQSTVTQMTFNIVHIITNPIAQIAPIAFFVAEPLPIIPKQQSIHGRMHPDMPVNNLNIPPAI